MKTKRLLAAGLLLLATVAASNATPLYDLPVSLKYELTQKLRLARLAYHGGWLGSFEKDFGWRDGYFFVHPYVQSDLLDTPDSPVAHIAWDFAGTDFRLIYVDVFGVRTDESVSETFYKVRHYAQGSSDGLAEVKSGDAVKFILFYGSEGHVPETGSSVLLLGLSLTTLIILARSKV